MYFYLAQYISEKDKQLLPEESVERVITNIASEILRNNYEALSLSIDEPVQLATLLEPQLEEKILRDVELHRRSLAVSIGIILKAVRVAVRKSNEHLELLVSALRKFDKTVYIADAIFKEYSECVTIFPSHFDTCHLVVCRNPEQGSGMKKEVDCYNETLSYGVQSVTGCSGMCFINCYHLHVLSISMQSNNIMPPP